MDEDEKWIINKKGRRNRLKSKIPLSIRKTKNRVKNKIAKANRRKNRKK